MIRWLLRITITLLAFAFLVAGLGCTDDGASFGTLDAAGYTKIRLTGWEWGTCSDSDGTCTGFEAVGPTGRHVTGAVGCGRWMKGCTIRVTGSR